MWAFQPDASAESFKPLLDVFLFTKQLADSLGWQGPALMYTYYAISALIKKKVIPWPSRSRGHNCGGPGGMHKIILCVDSADPFRAKKDSEFNLFLQNESKSLCLGKQKHPTILRNDNSASLGEYFFRSANIWDFKRYNSFSLIWGVMEN